MKVVTEKVEKKKLKLSKNKKKAWRKQVDISDIEKILDDVRREERYGGPLEERKDEELMFLDIGVDDAEDTPKETQGKKKSKDDKMLFTFDTKPGGKKVYRDLQGFKPTKRKNSDKSLKCFRALEGLPGAKVSITPRQKSNRLRPEEKKVVPVKTVQKYQKKVRHIGDSIIRDQDLAEEAKTSMVKDVWDDSLYDPVAKQCIEKGVEKKFDEDIASFYKAQIKLTRPKVPAKYNEKPSELPAVQLPKGGFSYNPNPKDHQQVLREASKWIKKKRHIEQENYPFQEMIRGIHPLLNTRKGWRRDMSEGLPVVDGKLELPSKVYRLPANDEGGIDGTTISKAKVKERRNKENKKKKKGKNTKIKEEVNEVDVKHEDGEEEPEVVDVEAECNGTEITQLVQVKVEKEDDESYDGVTRDDSLPESEEDSTAIEKKKISKCKASGVKQTTSNQKAKETKTSAKITVREVEEGQKGKKRKNSGSEKESPSKKSKVEKKRDMKQKTGAKTTVKEGGTVPAKGKGKGKEQDKNVALNNENKKKGNKTTAKKTQTISAKGNRKVKEGEVVQTDEKKKKNMKTTVKKAQAVSVKGKKKATTRTVKKVKVMPKKKGINKIKKIGTRKTVVVKERRKKTLETDVKQEPKVKQEVKTEKEDDAPVIKKTNQKKTQKQRQKEREKKHKASLKKQREIAAERQAKVELIPEYLKNIKKKEGSLKKKRLEKQEKHQARKSQPHRLAKRKFLEEDMDVALPEQLPGSLRQITSVGNLSRQCVMHFMRRNMLAPERLYRMPDTKEKKRYTPRRYKEKVANGMQFGLSAK